MKKIAFVVAAAALLTAQAFAQSPPGPAGATPMGNGMGPASGDMPKATPKPSKEERKAAGMERRAKMKAANKAGEIPSPTVSPKSY